MHLLRSRPFLLLVLGQAVNGIGSWAALVAMWGFAAYQFESGPAEIAVIGLAWSAPAAVVGPFAGVPIDRFGAKKVLVGAYLLGALAAIAMSFSQSYAQLVALGGLLGLSKAFARPATDTLPPRLVDDEDLLGANAILGAAAESAIVFGPLVAALAITMWGLRGAFLVDAATYVVGIAVVVPLALRSSVDDRLGADGAPAPSLRRDLREGFSLVVRQPVLRFTLLLSAIVFVTWSTFVVVEPIYVRDVLDQPASFFAILQTAFGIGLVSTGLLLPRLGDRVAGPRALSLSVLLSGLTAALSVGTSVREVAVIGVFLWGVDVAFFSAPSRTLLQRHSPPAAHGRVLSLYQTVHSGADLVVLPLAGLAAGAVGVQPAALAVAILPIVAGLVGFRLAARLVTPTHHAPDLDTAAVEPALVLETPLA